MTVQPAADPFVRPSASRPLERLLAIRVPLNAEVAFYAIVIGLAIALRYYDLGSRALHHDESIHAQWSWDLLNGNYRHSPVFHGPFYYHLQAAFFLVFGENDYTSRLSAATFGTAIVALPLMLRRWLGPLGTMAAVAFIAFSPTAVYYSRFFREDIYMAFFVLLTVVALWRYIEDGRERWLFVFAAGFIGGVTTKEGMFLTVAVFLVALDAYAAYDLAERAYPAAEDRRQKWLLCLSLAPIAWLVVALWPFLGRPRPFEHEFGEYTPNAPAWKLRERYDWAAMPRSAELLLLLGTLTLPLLTPLLRIPIEKLGLVDAGAFPIVGGRRNGQTVSRLDWEFHLETVGRPDCRKAELRAVFPWPVRGSLFR